ncbi:MAG: hypothetical protein OXH69_12570 [Acidobacteria bacterium]|nr:hypothetical protein [Acidobacteriota bacterium]
MRIGRPLLSGFCGFLGVFGGVAALRVSHCVAARVGVLIVVFPVPVVVLAVPVPGGRGGTGPPIPLHLLKGVVQRPGKRAFALAPFHALDPLQQTPIVDGQQVRDVVGGRAVAERRQELVEQVVGGPPLPRPRTVEVHPDAQAVVRLTFQYALG